MDLMFLFSFSFSFLFFSLFLLVSLLRMRVDYLKQVNSCPEKFYRHDPEVWETR